MLGSELLMEQIASLAGADHSTLVRNRERLGHARDLVQPDRRVIGSLLGNHHVWAFLSHVSPASLSITRGVIVLRFVFSHPLK